MRQAGRSHGWELLCGLVALASMGLSFCQTGSSSPLKPGPRRRHAPPPKIAADSNLADINLEIAGPMTAAEAARLGQIPKAWSGIVIHHTVVTASAASLARSHLRRGFRGLAYHFLIVKHPSAPGANVFVSRRWLEQQPVPHTGNDAVNHTAIAIALVGNFEERTPTAAQLSSLQELLLALAHRFDIGPRRVRPHRSVTQTLCPGSFLAQWIQEHPAGERGRS